MDDMMTGTELEVYAERAWAMMDEEERKEYDNDFDFFVNDLFFCFCT